MLEGQAGAKSTVKGRLGKDAFLFPSNSHHLAKPYSTIFQSQMSLPCVLVVPNSSSLMKNFLILNHFSVPEYSQKQVELFSRIPFTSD